MNNLKNKVISRNPDHYQRVTKHDTSKVPQKNGGNEDPLWHAVENTCAMDATELERVFAKPFVTCFDGHNEGVGVLSNHPLRLSHFLFGARDGQVKIWRLSNKKCLQTIQAHNKPVNGISVDGSVGEIFRTVGQDSQLKHWPDFVIAGESIFVWKLYRDSAVRTYDFGPNTVHSIRWQVVQVIVHFSYFICCQDFR